MIPVATTTWSKPAAASCAGGDGVSRGVFDRVVLRRRGGAPVAAEVLDHKTGGEDDLDAAVEHHRPQMEAYRRALSAIAGLPPERITARLLFLDAGRVVDV